MLNLGLGGGQADFWDDLLAVEAVLLGLPKLSTLPRLEMSGGKVTERFNV
jgi:hypothetical protein